MNATLAGLVLSMGATIALVTLALMPRLCLRPLVRDRMIALLDDFDTHVRRGRLPETDPAVIDTRRRMLTAIRASNSMRLLDYLMVSRALGSLVPRPLATPERLEPAQRKLLHAYQVRFNLLTPYAVFTGSWAGIVYASAKMFHLTWRVLVRRVVSRRVVSESDFAEMPPRVAEAAYVTAREQVAVRDERRLTLAS